MKEKPAEILLVEDSPDDIDLTIEALDEGKLHNNLNVVMDGEEALLYLKKEGKYDSVPTPDLILLDLNLPKLNGKEVLKEIKEDKDLRMIPVIILTTSKADEDIMKAYDLHANCYVTKPVGFESFVEVVKKIEGFWFSIVKLPN